MRRIRTPNQRPGTQRIRALPPAELARIIGGASGSASPGNVIPIGPAPSFEIDGGEGFEIDGGEGFEIDGGE